MPGCTNYQQLLRDPVFWQAFWNTAFYIVTIVPLQLALGLIMAVGLNQAIRGVTVYRLIYFMPVVTTIVAGAIVFRLLLATNGPVNNLLAAFVRPARTSLSARRTGWAAASSPSGRW